MAKNNKKQKTAGFPWQGQKENKSAKLSREGDIGRGAPEKNYLMEDIGFAHS